MFFILVYIYINIEMKVQSKAYVIDLDFHYRTKNNSSQRWKVRWPEAVHYKKI